MSQEENVGKPAPEAPEPEVPGSIWKHPYLLYAIGNVALFALLLIAGWLAWTHDWIPHR